MRDQPVTGNAYDKYGSTNPLVRRMMGGFFAAFDRCLPESSPTDVLEVGIGEGEILRRVRLRWPRARAVGVDLHDMELASRWQEHRLTGAFASIDRLPFPDRTFDLVLAIEVLEHVTDPEGALAELSRVARGDLVLSVPREPLWRMANLARGRYIAAFGNTPGHIQHWSSRRFADLVRSRLRVRRVVKPLPWTMIAAQTHAQQLVRPTRACASADARSPT